MIECINEGVLRYIVWLPYLAGYPPLLSLTIELTQRKCRQTNLVSSENPRIVGRLMLFLIRQSSAYLTGHTM